MARTSSQKKTPVRKVSKVAKGRAEKSTRGLSSSSLEENLKNYRDSILEWSDRPAVKYVAGGIGLAILGRIAFSMSDRYPEIAKFFREGIETVEGRLREFRGIEGTEDSIDARH